MYHRYLQMKTWRLKQLEENITSAGDVTAENWFQFLSWLNICRVYFSILSSCFQDNWLLNSMVPVGGGNVNQFLVSIQTVGVCRRQLNQTGNAECKIILLFPPKLGDSITIAHDLTDGVAYHGLSFETHVDQTLSDIVAQSSLALATSWQVLTLCGGKTNCDFILSSIGQMWLAYCVLLYYCK